MEIGKKQRAHANLGRGLSKICNAHPSLGERFGPSASRAPCADYGITSFVPAFRRLGSEIFDLFAL